MEETESNRFDRLTNLDIKTHYRDREYWLIKSDFLSAFAYWVVAQSPYSFPVRDLVPALTAFDEYIGVFIKEKNPKKFTYDKLREIVNDKVFESIPEIEKLNHAEIEIEGFIASSSRYHDTKPEYDYIDLGALSNNIFYMILREHITQDYFSLSGERGKK